MSGIKLSEKEVDTISELVDKLSRSMSNVSDDGTELLSRLDSAFLAVDDKTIKRLQSKCSQINSIMWRLKVGLYKMNEFQERIVESQELGEPSEWNEF